MLKKEEYIKTVRRPYPPFFVSLILIGSSNYEYYKPVLDKRLALRNIIRFDGLWYFTEDEINNMSRVTFEDWKDPKKIKKVKKIFVNQEKALIKATKLDFTSFCNAYEKYMPALILVWRADEPVAEKLQELLEEKLSFKEIKELMNIINIPLEDNFYKKEEYDLVTCKNLEKHVKEYEWINSRYGEKDPYTVEQAKEHLLEMNKKEFLKQWKKNKVKVKNAIKYAKKILGKEKEYIIDFMQFIVYYRTQRTDIMNKAGYLFIPQLERIAKEKGITYKQLLHCTKDEILGKLPPTEIINERIKGHAIVMEDGDFRCLSGEESAKIRDFFKEELGEVKEFKGNIASRGIVKGEVKLIFSKDDFLKIKEGDILVTSMTTPQMISIMKKAAAFVTDEGGITCHAAIISRELKKPCIIGTKIATAVLHDGDVVEVDATKGIVRKIGKL